MPKLEQTFIAFDFGTKSIGVATGQSITQTATPQNALKAVNGVPKWHLIKELVATWKPDALVVGIPLNMDGSMSDMGEKAKQFAERCQQQTGLPVHECDERLTTHEAKQILLETLGPKALQKTTIDSFSAKLILESWMKNHIMNGN